MYLTVSRHADRYAEYGPASWSQERRTASDASQDEYDDMAAGISSAQQRWVPSSDPSSSYGTQAQYGSDQASSYPQSWSDYRGVQQQGSTDFGSGAVSSSQQDAGPVDTGWQGWSVQTSAPQDASVAPERWQAASTSSQPDRCADQSSEQIEWGKRRPPSQQDESW